MTPSEILADMRARGIRLWVIPGPDYTWSPRLDPVTALTAADKANLVEHRQELINLLLAEDEGEPVMEWVTLANGERRLLILYSESDRSPAIRDVRFADPEGQTP